MNIQCIKLSTGEDLIGDVSEQIHDGSVTISKPMAVGIAQGPNGSFQVGIFPFLPFAKDKQFTFRKENVLLIYEPVLELWNQYSSVHGTGIVQAGQSPIHLV